MHPLAMEMIRLRITALICSCLLAAPFSIAAPPGSAATPGPVGPAAQAPSSIAPPVCLRAPALCAAQLQTGAPPQATSLWDLSALWKGPAFFSDPVQAGGGKQTPSGSGQEPTLQGLGFPPSMIQGNAREQALLNKRSHMLQIHQKLGLLTAIPMALTLFTGPGAKGHHGLPGSPSGRQLHATLGAVTVGMYIATAYFAMRAPKVPGAQTHGLIRLHKALAWVHGPGMVLTPILGAIAYSQLSNAERIHGIAKFHTDAAVATFGAYMAAILSVSIK
jgi:hypothetical protein